MIYVTFSNEAEFKALIEHFDGKGWKTAVSLSMGEALDWSFVNSRGLDSVEYVDNYFFGKSSYASSKPIDTPTLAAIAGFEIEPLKQEYDLGGNTKLILKTDSVIIYHETGGITLSKGMFETAITYFKKYHE